MSQLANVLTSIVFDGLAYAMILFVISVGQKELYLGTKCREKCVLKTLGALCTVARVVWLASPATMGCSRPRTIFHRTLALVRWRAFNAEFSTYELRKKNPACAGFWA